MGSLVTDLDALIDISECFTTMFNFSGFEGNQFDNDEEGRGNKVYLQSDTRQIPCQIHPDGTNQNQITVITPAFEYVNQISKINSTEWIKRFSKLELWNSTGCIFLLKASLSNLKWLNNKNASGRMCPLRRPPLDVSTRGVYILGVVPSWGVYTRHIHPQKGPRTRHISLTPRDLGPGITIPLKGPGTRHTPPKGSWVQAYPHIPPGEGTWDQTLLAGGN